MVARVFWVVARGVARWLLGCSGWLLGCSGWFARALLGCSGVARVLLGRC